MAETINNKPSIQIRSGLPSPLPDKSPSPATKLLISHGKPNFTIGNKSPKAEENGSSPLSPQQTANNNYNPYKSATNNGSNSSSNGTGNGNGSEINKFIVGTKFNGVFKPSTAATSWATATATTNGNGSLNGNGAAAGGENEASKVVLRRPKAATTPPPAEAEDDNVPEFIRRQRRIQERLAKENVLDFENRRSGYFTHVVISPDSPNRTSFVETMASPAIVPSLEMPAPVHEKVGEEEEEEQKQQQQEQQQEQQEQQERATPVTTSALISEPETVAAVTNGHSEEPESTTNGHADHEYVAPEEVAKAIEEVNKAVAGEDDDKPEAETPEPEAEPASAPAPAPAPAPVPVPVERKIEPEDESKPKTEEIIPATAARTPSPVEAQVEVVQHVQNGETAAATAAPATNGQETDGITISHTNGQSRDGPSIPSPDPSGALGVNYEPKTVVSFSQELGGGENNYPDTVKVVTSESSDGELKDLAKLKFDIKTDGQADDVQVTPVLRAE